MDHGDRVPAVGVRGTWRIAAARPGPRDETGRVLPHAAHFAVRCCPQAEQNQSCPRRWKDRSGGPHCAQHGGETACKRRPSRSATSRSPTARGAGDLPSASTAGRSARADARRRDLARPPATAVTTIRTCSAASRGSAAATRSVTSPTGSDIARPPSPPPVTFVPDCECGPAWTQITDARLRAGGFPLPGARRAG